MITHLAALAGGAIVAVVAHRVWPRIAVWALSRGDA
jgi:hypothetical protein